ncbi:malonic semialdehyde reductase [Rubripirellula obstinata]|uniref:Malonic semialdehyde reductase n=1 Tax=Rubripirellula obstinata TaxID=406547 RepID=A0A5B1CEB5_9BACT|nr:nitroreductase family protein [Rubripirellula obstinata]KAA1257803.1 malonic semialdehyde reductase [Rubripirellula obstinata]
MTTNPIRRPVIDSVANRYSPYRFEDRAVEDAKILRCLEAARWASSSFNDQPWSWIIAKREDEAEFERIVSCLMEANQGWASGAGVLLLSVSRTTFRYNGSPNRVALHDLGQAAAQLSLQAADLGLQVHQMAGIDQEKTRQTYDIPDDHVPQTAIAIGYPDTSDPSDDAEKDLAKREQGARKRMPLSEQVFSGMWGKTAPIAAKD